MKEIIKESKSKRGVGEGPNLKLFGKYELKHCYRYGKESIYHMNAMTLKQLQRFDEICYKYLNPTFQNRYDFLAPTFSALYVKNLDNCGIAISNQRMNGLYYIQVSIKNN